MILPFFLYNYWNESWNNFSQDKIIQKKSEPKQLEIQYANFLRKIFKKFDFSSKFFAHRIQ